LIFESRRVAEEAGVGEGTAAVAIGVG